MSDPEKPAFHVVDRRRPAQPTETTTSADPAVPSDPTDPAEGVPADTSSTNNDTNPAAPPQAPDTTQPETSASGYETDSAPASEPPADNEQADDSSMPMPDPASLLAYVAMQMDVKGLAATLLGVFAGQAWRALGLIAHPATGQIAKNLPEAQIAIDCVQFLLGKVENDLDVAERREMQRRLNDLRMNYVAKLRE